MGFVAPYRSEQVSQWAGVSPCKSSHNWFAYEENPALFLMLKKLLFLELGGDFVGFFYHLVVGWLVAGVV